MEEGAEEGAVVLTGKLATKAFGRATGFFIFLLLWMLRRETAEVVLLASDLAEERAFNIMVVVVYV